MTLLQKGQILYWYNTMLMSVMWLAGLGGALSPARAVVVGVAVVAVVALAQKARLVNVGVTTPNDKDEKKEAEEEVDERHIAAPPLVVAAANNAAMLCLLFQGLAVKRWKGLMDGFGVVWRKEVALALDINRIGLRN